MAYLLVLKFDNDLKGEAQAIADNYQAADQLVGAFYVPDEDTPFCKCTRDEDEGAEAFRLRIIPVRGSKYGWYICSDCKRPRYVGWAVPNNLRPQCDTPKRLYMTWYSRGFNLPLK